MFVSQLLAEETVPCQSVGNESWKKLKCWGQVQHESETMFTMFWKSYFYEDVGPGPRLLIVLPDLSLSPVLFRPVLWFISVNRSPYLWRCNVSGGHQGPSHSIVQKETLPKRCMNQNQSRWRELFFSAKPFNFWGRLPKRQGGTAGVGAAEEHDFWTIWRAEWTMSKGLLKLYINLYMWNIILSSPGRSVDLHYSEQEIARLKTGGWYLKEHPTVRVLKTKWSAGA